MSEADQELARDLLPLLSGHPRADESPRPTHRRRHRRRRRALVRRLRPGPDGDREPRRRGAERAGRGPARGRVRRERARRHAHAPQRPVAGRRRRPEASGANTIESAVADAEVDVGYTEEVLVAEDAEDTLLDAVDAYDTVCVGATREGALARALFGSVPETIGEPADGTVAMVRRATTSPRSIREAIVDRLTT